MSEHLILCGGVKSSKAPKEWRSRADLPIEIGGGRQRVHVKLQHLTKALCSHLPAVASDLLEIAAYVYGVDQAISRGGTKQLDYGTGWQRHLSFVIPVRRPDVWQSSDVIESLVSTLGFLSDDHYEFKFVQHSNPPPLEKYLFNESEDASGCEEVVLFSGGLDSLGGAVNEVLETQRKVALVSHRPVPKTYSVQKTLADRLASRVSARSFRPLHVAVEVNKGDHLEAEFTQRTRSFLFASLAAIVARMMGLDRIRFYENGITSMNLPICAQLVGARASRTTHPKSLAGFADLFSKIFDASFEVQNPFLWKTKTDVLKQIKSSGNGELCALTRSCSHTRSSNNTHTHCGRCSQCLDRRICAMAAGLEEAEDPEGAYSADVVLAAQDSTERTLFERYIGFAREVSVLQNAGAFAESIGEVARLCRIPDMPASKAVEAVFQLYKRHATQVLSVVERILNTNAPLIAQGKHHPHSLLGMICGDRLRQGDLLASEGTTSQPAGSDSVQIDDDTLELVVGSKRCFLGNTKEFALARYLVEHGQRRRVSYDELRSDVWQDEYVLKNSIQRVASNLRRLLRKKGIDEIKIDGSVHDRYQLVICDLAEV